MPVRKIPMNSRSLTGKYAVKGRPGETSGFESSLERDFMTILDFTIEVARWEEQPVEICYQDAAGRARRYYPDILVLYRRDVVPARHMPHELCEVKYREDLRVNWAEYKEKFKAARRYAREQGWRFRIMTEREIRTDLLFNARFLLPYRRHKPGPGEIEQLMERIERLGETTPRELLSGLSQNKWAQGRLISTLWYLLARRRLVADFTRPLSMETVIQENA